jgi:hypothetical protein
MAHLSRLARIRAMSAREVGFRGAYTAFTLYERQLHRRGLLARPDRLRRALVADVSADRDWQAILVRRERGGSFFAGVEQAEAIRARFGAGYRDEWARARRIADSVTHHQIDFFGRQFSFGDRIDWHADPVTQAHWPRAYHRDVPVHGGDRGFGDVKYVWELNRHQFLIDLAKVACLDGSDRHLHALQELLEDWLRQVPYATGAPWACALEPAFRTWSWLWAYHLLRAAHILHPAFHISWLEGFHDHGRFLYGHLEHYSSPYNHLIGEASALFALGLLFPEFKDAPAWVRRGREVLESALDSQFHVDGGSVEQSTFYHHATLGFYLLAALLGRRNGIELSPAVWRAIELGLSFSMTLAQPDGRVPRIGGADDGKPIRLEHLPFFDFRPYLAIGAAVFSRADFKFAAGRFWEDALWVLGPDGADAFQRLSPDAPARAVALPASGYYVARSSWSADADYLCFDCGPQAAGLRRDDVPSAAHGHADCLSVVATLGGREVLVDPGFLCYNGDPEWEVHFRRTLAHNTVVVDGADQARHVAKMAWTHTYAPRWEGWTADADVGWARGSHDGYVRGTSSIGHRRTAWLRTGGYVILYDEITGEGQHAVDVVFQFASGHLTLDAAGQRATFDGRFELAWASSAGLETRLACGGPAPADGWIAPSLGVRVAAPRLTLKGQTQTGPLTVLSIVADGARDRIAVSAQADLLYARIRGDGFDDEVLAARQGAVKARGISTDAPLVVVRRGRSGTAVAQAGGTWARFDPSLDADVRLACEPGLVP